ncbi:TraR/DksA family transcriptional regulator [Roseivivax marinus]|jgi:RNA polymerase-binding transcription factor DksA|uniref:TraR/DksA family transcriptional regulator n=1 Tax=Roseivivax marinus TaxID=1379903 RepID=W4HHT4_9RHOB|nr:TraR/DksA C4-type zinc finger protein [Roseivivax marinus]ETW11550.1 TraR/DksA family transcriptional regulator [Roseivivax marinus]UMA67132.1 TraR/DksA C4-type zinc finger protein [Roseivivax marinus]
MQDHITRPEQVLRDRRAELVTRLARISGELDAPLPADIEDQAIELEDDEVLEDLGHAGERELRAIDAALVRIENGTYGICQNCGEEISPARLKALPTSALCRTCAS